MWTASPRSSPPPDARRQFAVSPDAFTEINHHMEDVVFRRMFEWTAPHEGAELVALGRDINALVLRRGGPTPVVRFPVLSCQGAGSPGLGAYSHFDLVDG